MTVGSGIKNDQNNFFQEENKLNSRVKSYDEEIDMFLGISSCVNIQQDQIIHSNQKSLQIEKSKSESVQTIQISGQQDSSESPKEKKAQKSHHHNLQKHTVTALKNIVKQKLFPSYIEDFQRLEAVRALWGQFLSIRKKEIMTRKFLTILFRSDLESVELLKNYGFEKIFKAFSDQQIKSTKNEFRKITVRCFSQDAISEHVEKRQIIKKKEFKLYLEEFRNQLQREKLKKRISKVSSRKMEEILSRNTQ